MRILQRAYVSFVCLSHLWGEPAKPTSEALNEVIL